MQMNCLFLGLVLCSGFTVAELTATSTCKEDDCGSSDSAGLLQSAVVVQNTHNSIDHNERPRPISHAFKARLIDLLQGPENPHCKPENPGCMELGMLRHYKHWWLGVIICALGCLSSATGLLLMKLSGSTEAHLPCYQRYRWIGGFVLLIVNASILDMLAYSMMPLALMAPFSGLTIVFTTLLAQSGCLGVKEQINRSQWMSIAIVCTGVAAISVCGPRTSREVTEASINAHLSGVQFDCFAAAGILAVVVSMVLWLCQKQPNLLSVVVFAIGSSIAGAISQINLKIVSNALRDYFNFPGHHDFFSLPMMIGIGGLIAFAPPQLFLLNSALVNSEVAFAVSLYQTLLILFTIIGGYTFFDEFAVVSTDWMLVFTSGIVLAVAGLVGLASTSVK